MESFGYWRVVALIIIAIAGIAAYVAYRRTKISQCERYARKCYSALKRVERGDPYRTISVEKHGTDRVMLRRAEPAPEKPNLYRIKTPLEIVFRPAGAGVFGVVYRSGNKNVFAANDASVDQKILELCAFAETQITTLKEAA